MFHYLTRKAFDVYNLSARYHSKRFVANKAFVVQHATSTSLAQAEWINDSLQSFLDALPSGPYTAMRTINQNNIFEFNLHMNRLSHTMQSQQFASVDSDVNTITSRLSLLLEKHLPLYFNQSSMNKNKNNNNNNNCNTNATITDATDTSASDVNADQKDSINEEARIIVYINNRCELCNPECCISLYFQKLQIPEQPIRCVIRSGDRLENINDPTTKDTNWSKIRASFNEESDKQHKGACN